MNLSEPDFWCLVLLGYVIVDVLIKLFDRRW